MLSSLQALLAPALAERLTLVINHVLFNEPAATRRLQAHVGRTLALTLQDWPALLPAPPVLAWRITAAGLLEWSGANGTDGVLMPDLSVRIAAGNPALLAARMAAGEAPAVQIDGDAQLASDVSWLLANLRWDVSADLERLFGPVLAQQLHTLGSAAAAGLRAALKAAAGLGGRLRSRTA